MIPGIIAIPSGVSKSVAYNGSYSTTAAQSTYTFSSVNFGAPDAGRIIVVGLNYYEYDTTAPVSSFTIAGSTATSIVTSSLQVSGGTGSFIYAALYYLQLSSGSTGSVVISFSGGALPLDRGCSIGVWSLYNMSFSTPRSFDGDANLTSGDAATLTTNTNTNDVLIAVATGGPTAGATTWTNVTENYDYLGSNLSRSGASRQVLNNGTVNIDVSNASGPITAALVRWR